MTGIKSVIKHALPSPLLRVWRQRSIYAADLANKIRYGWGAPVKYQRLYIDPCSIKRHAGGAHKVAQMLGGSQSDVLAAGDWDRSSRAIDEIPLYQRARARVLTGRTWREVGEYDAMLRMIERKGRYDGCASEADLDRRYAALDRLIAELEKTRDLRPRCDIEKGAFREQGGIHVGVSRDGEVMKIGHGNHRLAIAQALRLETIPVGVAFVHPSAMKDGKWRRLTAQSGKLRDRHEGDKNPV